MERRVWTAAPALEVRADEMEDEDGKPVMRLRGYATVYGAKTELMWGMWRETVDDGAYDKSLAKDDIRTLWQHDTAQVLGRTSAGTMEAWSDKVGVGYATLPPSWAAALRGERAQGRCHAVEHRLQRHRRRVGRGRRAEGCVAAHDQGRKDVGSLAGYVAGG